MSLVVSTVVSYYDGMDQSLSGRKALVVGGFSGIGREVVSLLVREKVAVTVIGRESKGIQDLERYAKVEILDLESDSGRTKTVELARNTDILCMMWGPFIQKSLHDTSKDDWINMAGLNLAFPGSLVSAALPSMRANRWGRIVLFGGTRTDEVRGFMTNAAYAAAKTGLSSLARSVSLAYASEGISCNVVCPGFVDSGDLDDRTIRTLEEKSPDGALISVEDMAETVLFLLKRPLFNGLALRSDKGWEPKFI